MHVLHVFAHCMYLRYTNTCYKVLTFNSTDFLFLNTVLHTTDLMIHNFELHELFNSPKNVHLKALLLYLLLADSSSLPGASINFVIKKWHKIIFFHEIVSQSIRIPSDILIKLLFVYFNIFYVTSSVQAGFKIWWD